MNKIEEDELRDIGIPDPVSIKTEYIDKNGVITEEKKDAYAYSTDVDGYKTFFIKYVRGELCDPHNVHISSGLSKILANYKKVTENTYDNYVKFLETKNTLYFTRARRNLM